MKYIDAHLHFCPDSLHFQDIARDAGHQNTREHLLQVCKQNQIVHCIVMGNTDLDENWQQYPDCFSFCVGVDQQALSGNPEQSLARVEAFLQQQRCVGIKLYPGYSHIYLSDPLLHPYYRLAQKYDKPVAIHTGAVANSRALLKYSHPLLLDEVAVTFPQVRFVMCHMGNPWLQDAAAVLEKNFNVSADLSGLLVGRLPIRFYEEHESYLTLLKTWIEYVDDYSRLMYGTDWPLVNIPDYQNFISRVIPERHQQKVFFENANQIYQLGL